ncbi:MAG: MFS transporter [Alphaproteobacteria bacterium]
MKFLKKKSSIVNILHFVFCYSITLYNYFTVFLSPIFFPNKSTFLAFLSSYSIFVGVFVARPFGALFFGWLGDKKGRKKPLFYSSFLCGIPTCAIGFIPGYETIGVFAPILLLICCIAQGFFWGGEFTGVNLYIVEDKNKKEMGARIGLLISLGVYGSVIAALSGALSSASFVPYWGWRIPFIVGGICTLALFFICSALKETNDFVCLAKIRDSSNFSWIAIIKNHKWALFVSTLVFGLTIMPLYLITIFGNRIFYELGFSYSQCILVSAWSMTVNAFFISLFGRMADKIGFTNQMLLGTFLTAFLTVPIFLFISIKIYSFFSMFFGITLLIIFGTIINGCTMPYTARFFPTHCRYSAIALSVTMGAAFYGGTVPIMSTFLVDFTELYISPAIWLSIISFVVFITIYINKRFCKDSKNTL